MHSAKITNFFKPKNVAHLAAEVAQTTVTSENSPDDYQVAKKLRRSDAEDLSAPDFRVST